MKQGKESQVKPKFITDIEKGKINNKLLRKETTAMVKNKNHVIIVTLQDAKILLSKVIYQLQAETIKDVKARSILYAVSIYVSTYKSVDFEERLVTLESELQIFD